MGNDVPDTRGSRVVRYDYGEDVKVYDSSIQNQDVTYLTTRSCRLIHGSVSWLVTAFANTTHLGQQDPLEHWWMVIQTNKTYYIIQFYSNDTYSMFQESSMHDCDMMGLNCVDKAWDSTVWTENAFSGPSKNIKLKEIINWIKNKEFSAKYSLYTHNCQDLCKAIYSKFSS